MAIPAARERGQYSGQNKRRIGSTLRLTHATRKAWWSSSVLPESVGRQFYAALLDAARALVWSKQRQGTGTACLLSHGRNGASPCWEAGHGIPRSRIEVCRLRRRFRLYGGRAVLLPRQAIQKRPQTLQAVQSQARQWQRTGAYGNTNHLFRVRRRDNGSVQAYAGQTCAVPFVFSETTGRWCCEGIASLQVEGLFRILFPPETRQKAGYCGRAKRLAEVGCIRVRGGAAGGCGGNAAGEEPGLTGSRGR